MLLWLLLGARESDMLENYPIKKRSIRRHHRERIYRKRKKKCQVWWGCDHDEVFYKMMINTPTPCSCFMCGNPRRHFGERTLQERKSDLDLQEAA